MQRRDTLVRKQRFPLYIPHCQGLRSVFFAMFMGNENLSQKQTKNMFSGIYSYFIFIPHEAKNVCFQYHGNMSKILGSVGQKSLLFFKEGKAKLLFHFTTKSSKAIMFFRVGAKKKWDRSGHLKHT